MGGPRTERRIVGSDDPSLTRAANRLLTRELRRVVGRDEVVVRAATPDRASREHGTHFRVVATLAADRPILIVTLVVAIVVGGVVLIATRSFWALVVALALHALGTLLVTAGAIALTTDTEHLNPDIVARLEAEGGRRSGQGVQPAARGLHRSS